MRTKGKAVVYGVPYLDGGAGGGCLACPTFSGSALRAAGDLSSSAEGGVPKKRATSIRFLSRHTPRRRVRPAALRAACVGLARFLWWQAPTQELTNGG
jgi:hypothetical protein